MMHYTHLAFGLLVSLIFITFFDTGNSLLFAFMVIFFSIFPDIDETRSKIGRKHKIISRIINFFFGHRGVFHTIYIPIIIFIILNLVNFEMAIASLTGYFSHLFLDAITRQGIRPFHPLYSKRVSGPFKTNSISEKIMFLIINIANIYVFLSFL